MRTRESDLSIGEHQRYATSMKREGLAMASGCLLSLGGMALESSISFTAGMVVMIGASLSITVKTIRNEQVNEHNR